jgi:hypothetical protein
MDKDIIFDKRTKDFGGKFYLKKGQFLSCLLAEARKKGVGLIEGLRKINPNVPDVYIDFIDNSSFNAYTFKDNDSYYIGINHGAISNLYIFFNYLLSFPNVLSFVGNNGNEIEPIFDISNVNMIKPKDKERKIYAEGLFHFAVLFLIWHEYAHIIDGHLELKEEYGMSFISEMVSIKKSGGLISQTLEYDADCYAASVGIKDILINYQTTKILPEKIKPYFNSLEDALFLWTFSTYTLFRFFGNIEYNFNELDVYSHPYPGFRQHYIGVIIPTIIMDSKYSNLNDSICNKTSLAIKEVEDSLKILKKGSVTPPFIDRFHSLPMGCTYTRKGWEQMYKIQNNWRNVRPLLEPYCKVNLTPIEDLGSEDEFMKIIKKFRKHC